MPTPDIPFDLSLLAIAIEATQVSFIIADHTAKDDPIIFCNPAFEQMTGYHRKEILGHNCRFLQGNYRNQPGLQVLRQALSAGKEATVVLRNSVPTCFSTRLADSSLNDIPNG